MSMPSILYGIRCVDTGIKPAMREMEENRVNFIVYFMVHIVRQTEVLKDIVIMCHDDIYILIGHFVLLYYPLSLMKSILSTKSS